MDAPNSVQDGAAENGSAIKKRKRNRQAVSCSNCKAKKIKCSRQIPCEACLKRGLAADCKWAETTVVPPPQVFALDSVLDAVRAHFEGRIRNLESINRVSCPTDSEAIFTQAKLDSYLAGNGGGNVNPDSSVQCEPDSREASPAIGAAGASAAGAGLFGDEAETAAIALEVLAGGNETRSYINVRPDLEADTRPVDVFLADSLVWRDFKGSFDNIQSMPFLSFLSRRTVVDSFLTLVKNRATSTKLLNEYWVNGYFLACMMQSRFTREHEIFWSLVESGERDFDPNYIALLCIILAISIVAIPDPVDVGIKASDLYDLSRLALEVCDWRSNPSYRTVMTKFTSGVYMSGSGNVSAAIVVTGEAIKAAQALGIHKLGSDPANMPAVDRALPTGTLFAREMCLRLWWDIVVKDWFGATTNVHYSISQHGFDSAKPRNFDEDQLQTGAWDTAPKPDDQLTPSALHLGKIQTADYCRQMADLGPIPRGAAELDKYYAKMLVLDHQFVQQTQKFFSKVGLVNKIWPESWRLLVGSSNMNTRRLRLHRPLMTRGYRDPKFEYSVQVCVESAQNVLRHLSKLEEANAPPIAIWWVRHHAMSAVLALYIDVLHDADIGVDPKITDAKLADIPAAANIFIRAENSPYEQVRDTGRKARLLIEALEDAKQARRLVRGGHPDDYAKILRVSEVL